MLTVDEDQKTAIKHLVNFAKQPEAWYIMGKSPWIPGDNPEYVLHVDSYRCVFTYTLDPDGNVYRHLSISVPENYPNPIAAFQIAAMFGFTGGQEEEGICTGAGDNWLMNVNEDEGCVVLAQLAAEPGKAIP
jgi:hypothetical protein